MNIFDKICYTKNNYFGLFSNLYNTFGGYKVAGKKGMKKDNTHRWLTAIRLSLLGKDWIQIARELDVGYNTLWNWRQEPEFQKLHTDAHQMLFKETTNQLAGYLSKAFVTECEIMENKENSPSIRLGAAEALAKQILESLELDSMLKANQKTLETLEKLQSQDKEGNEE